MVHSHRLQPRGVPWAQGERQPRRGPDFMQCRLGRRVCRDQDIPTDSPAGARSAGSSIVRPCDSHSRCTRASCSREDRAERAECRARRLVRRNARPGSDRFGSYRVGARSPIPATSLTGREAVIPRPWPAPPTVEEPSTVARPVYRWRDVLRDGLTTVHPSERALQVGHPEMRTGVRGPSRSS